MLNNSWNYGAVLNQDGDLLIGQSSNNPVAAFLSSSGQTLLYTFGPGSLNIEINTANTFFNPLQVANGGTGRTVLTQFGVLIGEGSNRVNVTAAGTSGQILIASTTGDPKFSTITSSGNTIAFTAGPNSLNIELNGSNFTFLIPWTAPLGGTGRTVLTTFGVILGEGSNNVKLTAAGTSGQILIGSTTGDPSFASLSSTGASIVFSRGPNSLNLDIVFSAQAGSGGTGRTILTSFGVLIGEGSNSINVTAAGTHGQVLLSSTTGDPKFATVTSSGNTVGFTYGPNSLNVDMNVPVIVPFGGTGRTILTTFGILIGEGSNAINAKTGTHGQVLIGSTTGDPAFASIASSGNTLSFTVGPNSLNIDIRAPIALQFGGTGRVVLTTFGVLLGEGSNNINVTAAGTSGQILIGSTTGDPAFASVTSSGGSAVFTVGPNSLNIEVNVTGGTFFNPLQVPNGGTGRTILTSFGVILGEGSNKINVTAAGTHGGLLIASTTGDPAFTTVTSSGATINFTAGPNSLNIDLSLLTPSSYGTGRTILTTFGVLIGEGSNNVNVTAAGTHGQMLLSSTTGDPKFSTLSSTGGTLVFAAGPNSLNVDINFNNSFFTPLQIANGGTGRTLLTTFGVLVGEGSNRANVTTAGTSGQILISSTTGDPKFSTLTSSGGSIVFTAGPNSLNIDFSSIPLPTQFGGTGRTILTTFGVLVGEGSNNVNVTAAGTHGQVLVGSTTGDPAFTTLSSSGGTLNLTGGPNSLNIDLAPLTPSGYGTGRTILTTFGVLIGEGSNSVNVTAAGTQGQILIASTTGDPAFTTVTSTGGSIVFTVGPNSLNIEATIIGNSFFNPLQVSNGGTGRTILTTFGVLIGEGSNKIDVTASGTHGQVFLASTTGDPAFASFTSSGNTLNFTVGPKNLNLDLSVPIPVSFGGTGRTVLTRFGVLVGEGSNNVNVTAGGTHGQVLISSTAGDPAFASLTSSGGTITFTVGPKSLNLEIIIALTASRPIRVENGGTGRTNLTTFGVLIGEGSNNVNVSAKGTHGQLLIGSTTGDPKFSTVTSSGNTLSFTVGPNSLNIEAALSSFSFFNLFPVGNGGTGRTILTTFGVLIGEGSNNVNVTSAGTHGQLLIASTTGNPIFATVRSSGNTLSFAVGPNSLNIDILSPIPLEWGGTGQAIFTTFGVLLGEGSNDIGTTAAATSHGQLLIASTTGDPAFNTITSTGGTLSFTTSPRSLNIDLQLPLVVGFGGLGRTILTRFGVLVGEGANKINVTAAGTQGQVLIGSTIGDPKFASITSSGGTITFTTGPHSLNIELNTRNTFFIPLKVGSGGTGRTILTTFGVLIGEGSNNINVTAKGTSGQVLIASTTGDPKFSTITSSGGMLTFTFGPKSLNIDTRIAGTFFNPVLLQNGGTGRTVLTQFGVLVGEGSNKINVTAAGTNGQAFIASRTGDPKFSTITSSGGTITFTVGPNSLNIELVLTSSFFAAGLIVPNGGLGRTVFTTFGVLIGEGSNSVNVTAAGTDGTVLIGSKTGDPAFSLLSSTGKTIAFAYGSNSLNIDAGVAVNFYGTGRTVLTTFGVLIGEGSNNVNVTAPGTNGQILIAATGADPAFNTLSSSGATLGINGDSNSLNIDLLTVPVIIGGTGRTVLTTFGVLIGEGSNPVNVTDPGTNGQVLIASKTGDPAFASITSTAGTVTFTFGPNSLNIDANFTNTFFNPVVSLNGGVGSTVLTTFGVLIGEGSNNLNVSAPGTNGQVLLSSTTGDPAFGTITSTGGTVSFTFGPNSLNIDVNLASTFFNPVLAFNGGTGQTVLTSFGVLIGEGSQNVNVTNPGTNGQVLIASTTGDPAFGTITSTGQTITFTFGPNSLNVEFIPTASFFNPLQVPNGATGWTVLTTFGVLIGEGSNPINLAVGTNGQVLIASTTGDPAFSQLTSTGGSFLFTVGPNSLNIDVSNTASFATTLSQVAAGTTQIGATNYYSVDSSSGTVTLVFPDTTFSGSYWTVKDSTGGSAVFPIIFKTTSGLTPFDGDTIFNLINPYGAFKIIFNSFGGDHYEIF